MRTDVILPPTLSSDRTACYTRNYAQKYQLGLIDFESAESSIKIEPCVEGVVVVGGYEDKAIRYINELKRSIQKCE